MYDIAICFLTSTRLWVQGTSEFFEAIHCYYELNMEDHSLLEHAIYYTSLPLNLTLDYLPQSHQTWVLTTPNIF